MSYVLLSLSYSYIYDIYIYIYIIYIYDIHATHYNINTAKEKSM